jgi:hypothetical protein
VPTLRVPEVLPVGAINPKKSMARKAQGQCLSRLFEKPPRAHDAGLITPDRPGGGFCINCPKTNPTRERAPPGRGGLARVFASPRGIEVARWTCQAHWSVEFFRKIYVLPPQGECGGRERCDSRVPVL